MKLMARMTNENGFLMLIELLVVLAIILGVFYVFTGGPGGSQTTPGAPAATPGAPSATPGGGSSVPFMALQAARRSQCASNLTSVRQAIEAYKATSNGQPPSSLQELRLSPDALACPVSKQPYTYDPQTGQVQCTTPGH
jgi:hypothetical protein